ncbi:MAG TPA: hypothetical protein PLJ14_08585, partial [Accumulibacter sp.]|nr:hypothetical protein [Accumulibacter sp.]
ILTGGQIADVTQGAALTVGIQTTAVTADKGYDSDEWVETRMAGRVRPPDVSGTGRVSVQAAGL